MRAHIPVNGWFIEPKLKFGEHAINYPTAAAGVSEPSTGASTRTSKADEGGEGGGRAARSSRSSSATSVASSVQQQRVVGGQPGKRRGRQATVMLRAAHGEPPVEER
jgi:hypothetical protein